MEMIKVVPNKLTDRNTIFKSISAARAHYCSVQHACVGCGLCKETDYGLDRDLCVWADFLADKDKNPNMLGEFCEKTGYKVLRRYQDGSYVD